MILPLRYPILRLPPLGSNQIIAIVVLYHHLLPGRIAEFGHYRFILFQTKFIQQPQPQRAEKREIVNKSKWNEIKKQIFKQKCRLGVSVLFKLLRKGSGVRVVVLVLGEWLDRWDQMTLNAKAKANTGKEVSFACATMGLAHISD